MAYSDSFGGYVSPFASQSPAPFGQPTYANPFEFRGLFNDPSTVPFMTMLTARMGQLAQPGPDYGEYAGALRSQLQNFLTPQGNDPTVTDAISRLMSTSGAMPGNPYEGQYGTRSNAYYKELMQEPFSAGEEAAMKEKYFGQIELDRADARQHVLDQMGALGQAPTSGPVIEALLQVDRHYDQQRAQAQNQLLTDTIALRQQRHAQAEDVSKGLAGFGQNAQQIAAQFRNMMMQSVAQAAELAMRQREAAQQRAMSGLQIGASLAQLQQQRYQQQQGNWDQMLQLSQMPSQLVNQRMGTLFNMSGQPDLSNQFGNLMNSQQAIAQQQQQRQQNLFGSLGNFVGDVYGAYQNRNKPVPYAPTSYGGGYSGSGGIGYTSPFGRGGQQTYEPYR